MRNKLQIDTRARKANAAHGPLDDDESSVAAAQLGQIGRLDHGEFRVAPYPKACAARAILDREPLRRAAARLEFRSNASVARRQQRGRARRGRSPVQIWKPEVGDHPPPAVGPAGQQDKVSLLPDKALGQEIAGGFSDFRRAVVRIGRVQPPEPDGPAVRKRHIEALIDAGGLNPSGRLPASRKAATCENHGKESGASAKEPGGAAAPKPCAATVLREAKIHAKALPRDGRRV